MNSSEQFETIVSEHYEVLFKFAISLTRSQADAEDLTQQTFFIWAKSGHQLRDVSKVKTWLFTTLHRAFLASKRRYIRFPHHDLESVESELPPAQSRPLANHIDASQVLVALAKVDELYRAAVALFYIDDLSYDEIARVLEVPVGTVKSRLSRGIAQLRIILLGKESSSESAGDWDSSPTAAKGTSSVFVNPTSVNART